MQHEIADGQLVEIPVTGSDLNRKLRAVWAKGQPLPAPAQELLRIALRAEARSNLRPATAAHLLADPA